MFPLREYYIVGLPDVKRKKRQVPIEKDAWPSFQNERNLTLGKDLRVPNPRGSLVWSHCVMRGRRLEIADLKLET